VVLLLFEAGLSPYELRVGGVEFFLQGFNLLPGFTLTLLLLLVLFIQ
jgi:hypothetical protein